MAVVVVSVSFTGAFAQKVDKEKLDTGTKRATAAAKVLTDAAALPTSGAMPKELLAKARVIAVFPNVMKINVLFQKGMKGYGLAARRVGEDWSMPAFYGFGVSDKGWTKVKSESPGVIMIFTSDKVFEKDHIAIAGAVEGPVGDKLTEQEQKRIADYGIFFYALGDGELRGVSVADDSSAMSGLGIDNNINKAVFGLKGIEVLWDKAKSIVPVPSEIGEFRKALTALFKP